MTVSHRGVDRNYPSIFARGGPTVSPREYLAVASLTPAADAAIAELPASWQLERNYRAAVLWDRLNSSFFQMHVQGQAANFVGQHVKAGGCAGFQRVFAFHHGLVNLGAALHVVALDG